MASRARLLADQTKEFIYESVASAASITLDLTSSTNYFDLGTLSQNSTVAFGSHSTLHKKFIVTFIPGYNNSAAELDDITKWTLDHTTLQPHEHNVTFATFNNDGTKYYAGSASPDEIVEYNLSIPYVVQSIDGSSEVRLDIASFETSAKDVHFNNDGTKLFIVGSSGDSVDTFTLTTAYDLSTASHTSVQSVSAEESSPTTIRFNPDGTKMYIAGSGGDGIDQYSLSTAFDPTTETHDGFSSFGSMGTQGLGAFVFNSDGTKLFVFSGTITTGLVKSYNLSVAYDVGVSGTKTAVTERLVLAPDGLNNRVIPITLDRLYVCNSADPDVFIERGSPYKPTFSTSYSGQIPNHYSRGFRHFLEFETHDTGSNYQLVNYRKVII